MIVRYQKKWSFVTNFMNSKNNKILYERSRNFHNYEEIVLVNVKP